MMSKVWFLSLVLILLTGPVACCYYELPPPSFPSIGLFTDLKLEATIKKAVGKSSTYSFAVFTGRYFTSKKGDPAIQ